VVTDRMDRADLMNHRCSDQVINEAEMEPIGAWPPDDRYPGATLRIDID